MGIARNNEMRLLQRKNAGANLFPKWVHKVEERCDITLCKTNFLALEETDRLKEIFYKKVQTNDETHQFYSKCDFKNLIADLVKSIEGYQSPMLVLFHDKDEYLGACRITSSQLLANLQQLWNIVGADMSFASENLGSGSCVEINFYDGSGSHVAEGIYERTAWGSFAASEK